MLEDVVAQAAWSGWGFLVGWTACSALRPTPEGAVKSRRDWFVAVCLVVLGLAVVGQSILNDRRDDAQEQCFRENIATRSALNAEDFELQEDVVRRLAYADSDAERQVAYSEYDRERADVEKRRLMNPLDPEGVSCE